MAGKRPAARRLRVVPETLRTLAGTALDQVNGGAAWFDALKDLAKNSGVCSIGRDCQIGGQ